MIPKTNLKRLATNGKL